MKLRSRNSACWLLLLAAAIALVWARPFAAANSREAVAILRKAHDADRRVSYRADSETATMFCGRWARSRARVFHRKPTEHRIEYTSAPLAGMVIVNDGAHLWRLDPRHKILYRADAPRPEDPRKMEALLANYDVEIQGAQRIAGRKANVISVMPRGGGRGWKKLWLDSETGVQLGSEDYDADGKLIAHTRVSRIEFPKSLPDSAFARPAATGCRTIVLGEAVDSLPHLSRDLGFKVMTPAYLPVGFRLERAFQDKCGCNCGSRVAHLRYGDGLSSLSILECPACAGMANRCHASEYGAASVVSVDRHHINVSLIGNLSTAELRKIAESVR